MEQRNEMSNSTIWHECTVYFLLGGEATEADRTEYLLNLGVLIDLEQALH